MGLLNETPHSEITATLELLASFGVTREDLASLRRDKEKARQVVLAIVKKVYQIYKVMMDYNLSLAEMIKAGNYDWVDSNITDENFPIQGTGKQESGLVLVHMNRDAMTKEVREYMNEQGLEPAKIEHLLAFAAAYPGVQRQFPIAALGSSFVSGSGDRYCPCLHCDDVKRELFLYWYVDGDLWDGDCRFLAVGK